MRLYDAADERRIRTQALVREWTKSGLLDAAQGAALETELRVNLRRTNVFLRGGLALFTTLVVGALVALIIVVNDLDHPISEAVVTAIAAVGCAGLAHFLVIRERFYRFGVEEALAVLAVTLASISAYSFTYVQDMPRFGDAPMVTALVVAAAGGLAVYWRFGYVYAAIGAVACGASIPLVLNVSTSAQHALSAAVCALAFVVARRQRTRYGDEYPGDDYALIQAAALTGAYLTLHMRLPFGFSYAGADATRTFYWFTYAMVWVLPLAGLSLGVRGKDRALLDVSLVMLLATLLTNKTYLGWPRHEWDPILLGGLLMAVAIFVRRWLSSGPHGQRAEFTSARLLSSQKGAVTILGTASAGFQPNTASVPASSSAGFDGGRSGGAGASGTY